MRLFSTRRGVGVATAVAGVAAVLSATVAPAVAGDEGPGFVHQVFALTEQQPCETFTSTLDPAQWTVMRAVAIVAPGPATEVLQKQLEVMKPAFRHQLAQAHIPVTPATEAALDGSIAHLASMIIDRCAVHAPGAPVLSSQPGPVAPPAPPVVPVGFVPPAPPAPPVPPVLPPVPGVPHL